MRKLNIDPELKNLIPPLTDEERKELENSILSDGCRDAIVVWNDTIVDGHNRYDICTKNGIEFKTVEMDFVNKADAASWMVRNQIARRNLKPFQRAEVVSSLEAIVAEANKAKRMSNLVQFSTTSEAQNSALREERDHSKSTNYTMATLAGVSHDTYHRAKVIMEKAPEEVKQQCRTGEISINQAYQTVRREEKEKAQEQKRIENAEKIEGLSTPLEATGLFQTIVIDPPWDWGDEGDINQMGRAKPEYSTMPIDDIEQIPIGKIADENCHLYIWVTNRSLPKAFRLVEKWGFRYITCLTWVKPSFGMGNYFRGSTEQVIFAVKGSQPLKRHDVPTHFLAARGDGHSAKPDEFYDLVQSCSYAPYIDVFGRKQRDGWYVWGENS